MHKRFKSITFVIILAFVLSSFSSSSFAQSQNENIAGSPVLTSSQMGDFVLMHNPSPLLQGVTIYQLADYYLNIGRAEGIRGDIAFAQAIKETGYFKFGGDVIPEQNNYAGIGTTGGGVKGAFFKTAEEGARAQIQHLKAYASKEPLVTENVDPRFHLVTRGIAPKWTDLNGRWAVPGNNYGQEILEIYNNMEKMTIQIPNVSLPSNHKLPVAKLVPRRNVAMYTPDGRPYNTLQKDVHYRVYGVKGSYYDVGGGYLVKGDSGKVGIYIGRVYIKDTNIPLYGPDHKIKRYLKRGETVRVYSYDNRSYDVGGGYYIKKGSGRTYYLGTASLKQNTILYDKSGKAVRTLKKNESYRVYKIDSSKLDLGGGYYINYDKKMISYVN